MILSSQLVIPKSEIKNIEAIKSNLTLPNPEYLTKKKHAYSLKAVEGIPQTITFIADDAENYYLPRNYPYPGIERAENLKVLGTVANGYKFVGKLRDYQESYINDLIRGDLNDFVLQAPCGHGKTPMMLYMLSVWQKKALILVPTNMLAGQWVKSVEMFTPEARIKKFTTKDDAKSFSTKNADIIVATLELFKRREFPERFYEQFGVVVLEEAHKVGAPTYHPIIDRLPAARRIALSATFRRKDDMHTILRYHFGESVVMQNKFPLAQLLPVTTDCRLSGNSAARMSKKNKAGEVEMYESKIMSWRGVSFTALDTWVTQQSKRNKAIFAMMLKLIERGRTIIFLSKRRTILEIFHQMMLDRNIPSYLIVGGTGDIPQSAKDNCKFFAGIAQLAEEGIDIENADTLVLFHPIPDIEQAAGRIRRTKEGKKKPLVIWPYDDIKFYKNMYTKASQFRDVVEVKKEQHILDFIKSL